MKMLKYFLILLITQFSYSLFEYQTLKKEQSISIKAAGLMDFAWSPDGKNIAISYRQSGTLFNDLKDTFHFAIFDKLTGKKIRGKSDEEFSITALRYSPDNQYIACIISNGLGVYNINTQELKIIALNINKIGEISAITWSLDSQFITIGTSKGNIYNIDKNYKIKETFIGKSGVITSLSWSVDSNKLVAVSQDSLMLLSRIDSSLRTIPMSNLIGKNIYVGEPLISQSVNNYIALSASSNNFIILDQNLKVINSKSYRSGNEIINSTISSLAWSSSGEFLAATRIYQLKNSARSMSQLLIWQMQNSLSEVSTFFLERAPNTKSIAQWSPAEEIIAYAYIPTGAATINIDFYSLPTFYQKKVSSKSSSNFLKQELNNIFDMITFLKTKL